MHATSDWLDSAPLVIAHRGASSVAPENTLPAFEQAVELGAEAIELDAKCSRDGIVIVLHDRTLARTAGRPGAPGELAWDALRTADAGSWMAPGFTGVRIPTLDEVFESVGSKVLINVELSDYWSDQRALAERVVDTVARHGLERRVLVSSFQTSALVAAYRKAPEIPRGHLFGPTWLAYRDRWPQPRPALDAVHPHDSRVSVRRIREAHRRRRRVHVYTVNDPERMRLLWQWGVDGIITDVPDVCVRTRGPR